MVENSSARAPQSGYNLLFGVGPSRDPYRLLAYVHTSGSFAKKKIKREREKRSEKARPSETSGTRNEKEEQGQRTGENAKKEERQRGRVGVLLPADLSY